MIFWWCTEMSGLCYVAFLPKLFLFDLPDKWSVQVFCFSWWCQDWYLEQDASLTLNYQIYWSTFLKRLLHVGLQGKVHDDAGVISAKSEFSDIYLLTAVRAVTGDQIVHVAPLARATWLSRVNIVNTSLDCSNCNNSIPDTMLNNKTTSQLDKSWSCNENTVYIMHSR